MLVITFMNSNGELAWYAPCGGWPPSIDAAAAQVEPGYPNAKHTLREAGSRSQRDLRRQHIS